MSDDIIQCPPEPSQLATTTSAVDYRAVVSSFLRSQTEFTRRAYHQDLLAFARMLKLLAVDPRTLPTGSEAKRDAEMAALEAFGRWLFTRTPLEGNGAVVRFIELSREADDAPATINRRVSAVKSLLKLGRALGIVSWTIEVKNVRREKRRDMRGPHLDDVQRLIEAAEAQPTPNGPRNRAMIVLLFGMGLRSVEVRELDVEHVDFKAGKLAVRSKGATQRTAFTIPSHVIVVLKSWLEIRGVAPGPLFPSFSPGSRGARLTRTAFWRIITDVGKSCGVAVRPHGLRHTAITNALDLTGGDIRAVQKFSRHARVQTVMEYDDARRDFGGEIAEKVAAQLGTKEKK